MVTTSEWHLVPILSHLRVVFSASPPLLRLSGCKQAGRRRREEGKSQGAEAGYNRAYLLGCQR